MIGIHDAIRVTMEFLLIFGKTNCVEVSKIHEIHKFVALEIRVLYGIQYGRTWQAHYYGINVHWSLILFLTCYEPFISIIGSYIITLYTCNMTIAS